MITMQKLERYKKYGGDVDRWVSSQKDGADEVLTGAEWNQIEVLVQRLRNQKNGRASLDYRTETERVLKKNIEGADALSLIRQLD